MSFLPEAAELALKQLTGGNPEAAAEPAHPAHYLYQALTQTKADQKGKPRLRYDDEAGAMYLYFGTAEPARGICKQTKELYPGVLIDFLEDGRAYGLEVYSLPMAKCPECKQTLNDSQHIFGCKTSPDYDPNWKWE